MTTPVPRRARLRPSDVLGQGFLGLRTKRIRALLTGLGITIGIAAVVSVVGISASSRADLLAELDELGTDLLQVEPGSSVSGEDATLPVAAPAMIRRLDAVESASGTRLVTGASVRRTDRIDANDTGGISVVATEPTLRETLDASMATGRFLDAATASYPTVVLGSVAADRLGIGSPDGGRQVYLGDQWFTVIGVLEAVPLAPDIDRSAMIGDDVARRLFRVDQAPNVIRVRTEPDRTDDVWDLLGPTTNPESPGEVRVSRPSDAVAARAQADETLTALLLGLGAVALVVGGVGIANVMVISVLERRGEIGLRRALGATRRHIRWQFLIESVLLAGLGGALGVGLGALVTAAYATSRGWELAVPLDGLAGGVAASLLVGAVAGVYPATRAGNMAPADAIR